MSNEITKIVKELQNALTVAELNYEIWWVYKEKESRKRFVGTLNTYPLFFQTSLHAHFVAMIVSTYRIFEKRKDTINMPQLIKYLRKTGEISDQSLKKVESELEKLKPIWVKVSVIRNKMFGHRSNTLNHDEIWKEASVTPNQFKQLIDDSKRVLNDLISLWNGSNHVFNLTATKDTVNLLEDLKRLNEKEL